MLACGGISAGRGSLHSDIKGSAQRQPVFTVKYIISLWASEPRDSLGSGLISWSVVRQQHAAGAQVSLAAGAFIGFVRLELCRCVSPEVV